MNENKISFQAARQPLPIFLQPLERTEREQLDPSQLDTNYPRRVLRQAVWKGYKIMEEAGNGLGPVVCYSTVRYWTRPPPENVLPQRRIDGTDGPHDITTTASWAGIGKLHVACIPTGPSGDFRRLEHSDAKKDLVWYVVRVEKSRDFDRVLVAGSYKWRMRSFLSSGLDIVTKTIERDVDRWLRLHPWSRPSLPVDPYRLLPLALAQLTSYAMDEWELIETFAVWKHNARLLLGWCNSQQMQSDYMDRVRMIQKESKNILTLGLETFKPLNMDTEGFLCLGAHTKNRNEALRLAQLGIPMWFYVREAVDWKPNPASVQLSETQIWYETERWSVSRSVPFLQSLRPMLSLPEPGKSSGQQLEGHQQSPRRDARDGKFYT
jgi:hypothetical protein